MVSETMAPPQICRGGNCGHPADEHENGGGRCTAENTDYYGQWRCLCPYFTEEKM